MIRVGRGHASSAWQRMRLVRARQFDAITLAASTSIAPAVLASCCSPGRVDVSARSNALYDRCATEMGVTEVSPIASKRAGQRAMRRPKGSDSRRSLLINRSRLSPRSWAAFPLVRGRMVGLGGVEPPTSSLSGIEG